MKRIALFLFSFMLVIYSTIGYVSASSQKSLNELKKEQNEIVTDKNEMSQKLDETQKQKKTLFEEVQQLDDEIAASEDAFTEITNQLSETIQKLNITEEELIKASEKKRRQMETYKERLQAMYENGSISYWQVLFSSESFSDFFNRLEYISDIIGHDQRLLDELIETEELITLQLSEITQQKDEIERLREAEQQRRADLDESRAKKDEFMKALSEDEALLSQEIEELQKASDDIESLIKKKQAEEAAAAKKAAEEAARRAAEAAKKAAEQAAAKRAAEKAAASEKATADKTTSSEKSTYTGGKLAWPVPGYSKVSSDYKNRLDPITKKPEFHSGIDIPAPKGTKVLAAGDGTVITSGTQSGYGKTIIIDHGGGVYTLYGHNSKLIATVGKKVSRGDVVAEVGSTGHSTGNHCHFEVRINGKHTSPWTYLK